MTPKIRDAFEISNEIQSLMLELQESIEEIEEDESLTVQARHLVIGQLVSPFSTAARKLDKAADEFKESAFSDAPTGTVVRVDGFEAGDRFIAGLDYKVTSTASVQILNKDARNWEHVVKLLVDSGYARVIQKRLSPSEFVGPNGKKLLELTAGLLAIKETRKWDITKPKPSKK